MQGLVGGYRVFIDRSEAYVTFVVKSAIYFGLDDDDDDDDDEEEEEEEEGMRMRRMLL